jgi:NAD(P)-dependent dehydrogenase (short-subunit alcohol dehydrogenase family)
MNVLITGSTSGIGRETAIGLALQNCDLFLANRAKEKTNDLIKLLANIAPQCKVRFIPLELDSLQSVKETAQTFINHHEPLDILINNAGVLGKKGFTKDGYELAFGTNYLGHFLLTHLLQPVLHKTPHSRIISVASNAHWSAKFYSWDQVMRKVTSIAAFTEYGLSKLANIWHINEIATLSQYQSITAYSLHPGVIKTAIWRHIPKPFNLLGSMPTLMNSTAGAKTTLFCALTKKPHQNGQYFSDCKPAEISPLAQDRKLQKELWDFSMEEVSPYLS